MRRIPRIVPAGLIGMAAVLPGSSPGAAADGQFCIACKDPDQVYRCRVDTPQADLNRKGLELYCIIKTAKDGGHGSCAVQSNTGGACAGPVRSYTFRAPEVPAEVRDAAERFRDRHADDEGDSRLPKQKGGEPETLVDMTSRAVGASGEAARGAAGTTGDTVGTIGQVVGKAAKGAGSAAKTTGGAVTNAARTAYDCVRSLFSDCGSSGDGAPDQQSTQ